MNHITNRRHQLWLEGLLFDYPTNLSSLAECRAEYENIPAVCNGCRYIGRNMSFCSFCPNEICRVPQLGRTNWNQRGKARRLDTLFYALHMGRLNMADQMNNGRGFTPPNPLDLVSNDLQGPRTWEVARGHPFAAEDYLTHVVTEETFRTSYGNTPAARARHRIMEELMRDSAGTNILFAAADNTSYTLVFQEMIDEWRAASIIIRRNAQEQLTLAARLADPLRIQVEAQAQLQMELINHIPEYHPAASILEMVRRIRDLGDESSSDEGNGSDDGN